MKTLLLIGTVALAGIAGSAGATVPVNSATGTVTVNGSVAPKCFAVTNFHSSVGFGELAQSDGTLNTALGPQAVSFKVDCNSSTPSVSISATPMVSQTFTGTPGTGFTKTVNYDATMAITTTGGVVTFGIKSDGTSDGHASSGSLANPIDPTPTDNLTVTAQSLFNAGGVLVADTGTPAYQGLISITISPAVAGP